MREHYRGMRKRRDQLLKEWRSQRSSFGSKSSWQPVWKKSGGKEKGEEAPWNRPGQWLEEEKKRKEGRFLFQVFFAFILLSVTYLVFQSKVPASQQAQSFIREVMVRDYNFAGAARWYQEHVGGSPAILPAFLQNKSQPEKGKQVWVTPAKGKVIRPFDQEARGMVIRTNKEALVVAASEGWVVDAGKKEGLGMTVVIRHRDGKETWYGWLGNIRVKKKDWVKPRQLLGEVGNRGGESLLYFGMKQEDRFINPAAVISFD
ncbi:hypothetical protein GCM10011571_20650 [Marinithermofilum abyssi]|uniref:M23ase beta-sheet core domain-containing protein n=1 Tax=Marinithermofilum abyssi TaxID=1571185 RepID=A0A8J2VDU1_9BACL|nr:M23 family metallopeptidase [Marinithermofilum abyssi]GGE18600.1 hypothetical protein GCM10011571_20650 [Marinithermofilum abyssi]